MPMFLAVLWQAVPCRVGRCRHHARLVWGRDTGGGLVGPGRWRPRWRGGCTLKYTEGIGHALKEDLQSEVPGKTGRRDELSTLRTTPNSSGRPTHCQ